ncbi:TPA: CS6 fimbrial subunit B [Salmonella enterica subsp. enterica serovar Virchow]|nr:CS6 fimbrial subunit B [Salmonella enterica]
MKLNLLPVVALFLSFNSASYAAKWHYAPLDVSLDITQNIDIDAAVRITPVTHEGNPRINDTLYTVDITVPAGVKKLQVVPADGQNIESKMIGKMINQDAPDNQMNYYMKKTGGNTSGVIIAPGRENPIKVDAGEQYQFSAIYNGSIPKSGLAAGNYNGTLTVAFYSN